MMEASTGISVPELAVALAVDLALECQLIQAYLVHTQAASSPRLRRAFEQGLAIKRRHESELERVTRIAPRHPLSHQVPGPREIVQWYYDRERDLALRYREQARLSGDPGVTRLLDELAADQIQLLVLFKGLYRDFSSS